MLVLVIILIAATGYLFYLVSQTRTELTQTREQLLDEISKIHETTAVTTQTSRRSVVELDDKRIGGLLCDLRINVAGCYHFA